MKKSFLIALFAIIVFSVMVIAQENKAPKDNVQRGQMRGERMSVDKQLTILKDSLNLTGEQVEKIKKVLEAQRAEMQALREKNRGDREAMRVAMRERVEKLKEQLKPILTKEQMEKFEKMELNRRAGLGRGPAPAKQ